MFAGGGGARWPLNERPLGFYVMRVECLVISSTFYLLSSYVCRASILCIYYELLRLQPRMEKIILAAGAWVLICGVVSMGVQLGVGIQDITFVLSDLGPDAKQEGPKWVVYGVVPDVLSCVCDFVVFALPLRALWGLQMRDRRRKIRLILTFTVGFLACGLSLARVLAWKLPGYVGKTTYDPYLRRDAFEVFYPIEITFGILGACLPMLRPILHRKEYTSRASGQSFAMGRVPTAGSQAALTHEESLIRTDNVSDGSAHSFSREVDEAIQGAGSVRSTKVSSIHRPS